VTDSLSILVVSSDPALSAEIQAALRGLDGARPVVHEAGELRQGAEQARSRTPGVVFVEMTTDMRALQAFAQEVRRGSPETQIIAVFRPDTFGDDVSESAVLIEAIRAGVRDFLRRPVSSTELIELLERSRETAARPLASDGRVVSFLSNKGGVGKSTTAVNAACELAVRHPGRVLLIDASLQLGVCAAMLDLRPETTITEAIREKDRLDPTLLRQLATPHDCGLHLLAAPRDALDAAEIDDESMSRIVTLARRTYDFVIVDTFPMFDRVMVAVLDLSDRAFLILESVVPTLLGGVKLVELLDGLGYPAGRTRVVLNRYTRIAGNLKPEEVAERLNRDVAHVLPYEKSVITCANTGEPFMLRSRKWFGYGARLKRLVDEIDALSEQAHPRNGAAVPAAPIIATNDLAENADSTEEFYD